MKKITTLFALLCLAVGFAQVTPTPSIPTQQDQITLTFDATGTALENETTDLYAHTGANINGTRWQNVVGTWGDNTAQPQFVNTSGNIYTATLPGTLTSFYGAQTGDVISEICLVIRNAAGTAQTNPDIFIDIFQPGLNTTITNPQNNDILNLNQTITISGDCTQSTNLDLKVNGTSIATANANTISQSYTFASAGSYEIALDADNGTEQATNSISVYVPAATQTAARPAGLKNGVNENTDGSVTFVLAAPGKNDVMLIGDFTNWTYQLPYQMNKDGDYFWVTVPSSNFSANTEFAYQYVVDFDITIADPYSRLVLDDGFDQFIKPGNYPNLYPYPDNQTDGDISLYTYQATPYTWTTNNFTRPDQENLVVYELLVRDFSEEDSFQAVIDRIDYLADLGFNALQLMPVNEFEGADSWGYNPKYHMALDKTYGTPDKFKELIDLCHSKGIAVIIDVVYNHAFSQSPLCQMWWDQANFRPAASNPYMNMTPTHDFNVGYDFDHENIHTKDYVKQTLQYWIDEYRIDGFRFDLSKGFTQNVTIGSISAWNAYDQSRVNILNDYKNTIWNATSSDIYMILEHLGGNNEEAALANDGFMLWGKVTDEFNQNSMGFNTNTDVFRSYHTSRNFNDPHLVAYAESHDEERLMFKNLSFGNQSTAAYNVRTLPVALDQQEAVAAILYMIPGPKMLWQFGELGYEISINQNGRTGRKPIPWTLGYDTDQDRMDLYEATATFISLKTTYPETFNNTNNNLDLGGQVKRINHYGPNFDSVVVANFDVAPQTVNPNFSTTGNWYDFFNNNATINVTNTTAGITLQPGEDRLFTTQALNNPLSEQTVKAPVANNTIQLYPNPAKDRLMISSEGQIDEVLLYNQLGQLVKTFGQQQIEYNIEDLRPGLYLVQVISQGSKTASKLIIE